ncbi:Crp/Fnr family transcriptional regulator [Oceaniglobus indicus]|uniref:Crp/Fnr family transcriptional regulator n=1 Tax=Oceaniglobus indicus TaxID=2047749 RepID=UPI000C176A48|nr:Crp/Fnr family transcriptional regulator [Oceaniglobus indicus]
MHKLDESLLSHLPPFEGLDRGQLREILDRAGSHRFDQGETVFHEGEHAERFFLLLDGYVRVVRITSEGEHVIVLHIPPGQLFGIASAFGHKKYPASTVTAVESIALSWPMRLWSEFAAQYDGFSVETYRTIGKRMTEMHDRMVELATQQVEQRVANALLRLITQTGRKTAEGIEVDFPITRQDLSEMTGSTLHTVSRLLSAWEKQGIVESRRRHIVVARPHQLVILAEAATQRR